MANRRLPFSGTTSDGQSVAITEKALGHLCQLAGWEGFVEAGSAFLRANGFTFPADYRLPARSADATIWRTAPDRILVRSTQKLPDATSSDLVSLDLSDARICLSVSGPGAAGLLSRVVALDFGEGALPAGQFVQTGLHHVGVLIDRKDRETFDVLIPTTWATSLIALLADHLHASAPTG